MFCYMMFAFHCHCHNVSPLLSSFFLAMGGVRLKSNWEGDIDTEM